jgi:hypothetical protein
MKYALMFVTLLAGCSAHNVVTPTSAIVIALPPASVRFYRVGKHGHCMSGYLKQATCFYSDAGLTKTMYACVEQAQ